MMDKFKDFKITAKLKERAKITTERLYALYGYGDAGRVLPAVDELIFTILSQNTTDKNTWVAFNNLKERYKSWDMLLSAPLEDIIAAISYAGLSAQKGPRIKRVIEILHEKSGEITLDFLSDLSVEEGIEFLTSLPGVGRKTASCVLLFNFNKPAMPVDTHVLRISALLGLIPPNITADEACYLLEKIVAVEDYLRFHVNIIIHGRNLCKARARKCGECPLTDICEFLQSLSADRQDVNI